MDLAKISTEEINGDYQILETTEKFQRIKEKLENKEKITKQEWDFITEQLDLITYRSCFMEEKNTISDSLLFIISKLGMKLNKKHGYNYTIHYKTLEAITSFDKEKEINDDLLIGMEIVRDSNKEKDLESLLKQHREAYIFRENKEAYLREYIVSDAGILSPNERLYIHAYNYAYQNEKKLVKQYKNNK